jgi:antitoxin component YwqK of YwqJK toxin-antitoxin module
MFLGLKQGEELTYYKLKDNSSDIKELPLKSSIFYKDGLKHGKSIHYFKNGTFSFEGHFHEGKKHGRFVEVFKERPDLIKTECFYLDNKLHGKLVEYVLIKDNNSKNNWKRIKKHECEYDRGKLHGTKLEYDGKTEQIVRHIDYDHQKFHGKYIRYYQDGKKEYECELVHGKRHGTETRYYRDGIHPCEIRQYENGKLIHSQTF